MTAVVTATSAILAYGLQERNWLVFLAPHVFLIPSAFLVVSQLESTIRIATYLIVFHESRLPEPGWETLWYQFRKTGKLPNRDKFTLSIAVLFAFLGSTSSILTIVHAGQHFIIATTLALMLLIVLVYGCVLMHRRLSLEFVERYLQSWRDLRHNQ